MKFKFKKRYIFLIIIVLAVVLFLILGGKGGNIISVEMAAATKGNVETLVSVSGSVQEKSENNVYIETTVKVKDILVEENDEVKEGQKIVDFDLDTLNSNLETLKLNKEMLEINYKKATISDESGMLSLVTTENSTKTAKDAYERAEALYEVGAISKVEYDSAKTAYDNAKAGLTLSSEGMNYDIETIKKNIELTNVNIRELEKQISKLKDAMYSPADGIVSSIAMTEGAYATSATPIYKVVNNDELEIKCAVKEFTVKNLAVNQKVYITGDAFDGITYEGHIKSIAPIANTVSTYTSSQTTIEVIVDVDSEETVLKSGLNVTCDVVTDSSNDTVMIPVSSFSEDKDGNVFVYKIENGMLKKIAIEEGIHSDDYLEVKSGLNEGEKIVKTMKSSYSEGLKVSEER